MLKSAQELTIYSSLEDIWLHLLIAIFRSNMALGSQKELDLLICSAQN